MPEGKADMMKMECMAAIKQTSLNSECTPLGTEFWHFSVSFNQAELRIKEFERKASVIEDRLALANRIGNVEAVISSTVGDQLNTKGGVLSLVSELRARLGTLEAAASSSVSVREIEEAVSNISKETGIGQGPAR